MARAAARRKIQPVDHQGKPHALSELSDESVRCRVKGHRWEPHNAVRVLGGFDVQEVCESCGALRSSVMTNTGHVRSRRITYPEFYLADQALEPEDRDQLRLYQLESDFSDYL